jgi:Lrp/AsnC family transcriptional regulator, leucine-responsive regulatory protein
MTVEPADRRLLKLLQQDGRITNQDLAQAAGLSTSACWRRVRALEEAGTVRGYAALVDRERAGFATSAILHVSLERHDLAVTENFVRRVAARPEVLECFATTGDADYHMRVVVTDLTAYNDFLENFLFRISGVRQVRSNIVLKDIKTAVALPF